MDSVVGIKPGTLRNGSPGMSLVFSLLFCAVGDADYRLHNDLTETRRPGDVSNRGLWLKDKGDLVGAALIDGEVCVGLNTSLIGAGDEERVILVRGEAAGPGRRRLPEADLLAEHQRSVLYEKASIYVVVGRQRCCGDHHVGRTKGHQANPDSCGSTCDDQVFQTEPWLTRGRQDIHRQDKGNGPAHSFASSKLEGANLASRHHVHQIVRADPASCRRY